MPHFQERILGEQVIREMNEELERQNRIVDPCQDQKPWISVTQEQYDAHVLKAKLDALRQAQQQSRCLNGEHEAEELTTRDGRYVRVCRHCRSLFVPREA